MKKMIVIAALIGGMLMPAQMMAQNNRKNAKAKVENRVDNRDRKKGGNNIAMNKPDNDRKPGFNIGSNRNPQPPVVVNRPAPRPCPPAPVVVVNRPAPRPCPPPPPPAPHRCCNDNDIVDAAAAVVGLAALVALIAN
ncbi:MAG: hypothetical protein IKY73_06040 [Bacteroidaceae bacterium]|nr:hypothetical protein [Bacteroidaceae bacterium]